MKKLVMRSRLQRGFTIIEVMVVVVIIAILAAIVVPKIMQRPEQARMIRAQQDIVSVTNALDLYKLDNGFYPTTAQGLQALVKEPTDSPKPSNWQQGGYLKVLPVDPWSNPYHYQNPGSHGEVDIYSCGSGATATGCTEANAKVANWNLKKPNTPTPN